MWVAALPYFSCLLEFTERSLGLFHPQVSGVLEVMHTCYKKMHRYEEAIQCLQRVLILKEMFVAVEAEQSQASRESSRAVFTTMGQLAELYM
jgi:hypothetical protein